MKDIIYDEICGKYEGNTKEIFELTSYIKAMGLGKILISVGSRKIATSPTLGLGKIPSSTQHSRGRKCDNVYIRTS